MMKKTAMKALLGAVAAIAVSASAAAAQEVTLRMHQFLPGAANVPSLILDRWADAVEADSNGRIKIERYNAMALGGTPPELMDQVLDGIADIIWTVNGYTPSAALWTMYENEMQQDFAGVRQLGMWVHGPGMIHTSTPVAAPEDLRGMKIRGGSRMVNDLLTQLGAEPVGLPVTGIPEALSRGVIDGTTIPWEVAGILRVQELVSNHTEFQGPALYTLTFSFAMNQDVYDAMPADLQQVIDDNSGLNFSVFAGGTQTAADGPIRAAAVERGNTIITISESDAQVWAEEAQPIYAAWVADMESRGIDGQALIDEARALMAQYDETADDMFDAWASEN